MNPILEKVKTNNESSFALKEEILPYIKIGWHFHPEFELTYFTESTGKRFIGDHTANFEPGDLLLIGPNLPHYMRNDPIYYKMNPTFRIRAIVVHFAADFLGQNFFDVEELRSVGNLLKTAYRGMHIYGKSADKIGSKLEELLKLEGFRRLHNLLDILFELSQSEEYEVLATRGFQNNFSGDDTNRIDRVYTYLLTHFHKEIHLRAVANLVHMKTSAFCKFFKKRTGQTFTETLNEIRIGHACKLFMKDEFSVSEVCYQCGYNNTSYFNRKFKEITSYSPTDYRKRFNT